MRVEHFTLGLVIYAVNLTVQARVFGRSLGW